MLMEPGMCPGSVSASEPACRSGIDHLELLGVQVVQDVLVGLDPGSVQRGLELARSRSGVLVAHRSTLQLPVPEPPLRSETAPCPNTRNIHHTRGAENAPNWLASYTTTCVSLSIPNFPT
ncbi:hypothetical protein INR49_004589 [Caranx melampygus]|nr:hypothetical protein INR49_004589 [Caranx melampygus]